MVHRWIKTPLYLCGYIQTFAFSFLLWQSTLFESDLNPFVQSKIIQIREGLFIASCPDSIEQQLNETACISDCVCFHFYIQSLFSIFWQKIVPEMTTARGEVHWIALNVLILVLNLMTSDSCVIFRTLGHITIDTSQCLFQNFTEPVSKWTCLDSSHSNPMVSILYWTPEVGNN